MPGISRKQEEVLGNMLISAIKTFLEFIASFLAQKKYKSQAMWTFLLVIIFSGGSFAGAAYYTNHQISSAREDVTRKYIVDSLTMESIKKNTEEAVESGKRLEQRTDFIYKYLLDHPYSIKEKRHGN